MSETTPATADELAAVYLRGRDVACPGCGYNRRDGLTAGCPECQRTLTIGVPDPAFVLYKRSTLKIVAAMIMAVCILSVVSMFRMFLPLRGMGLTFWEVVLMSLGSPVQIAFYATEFIPLAFAGTFLVRLRRSPRGSLVSTRCLTVALIFMFGSAILYHVYDIVTTL